jgi:2-polyprenyl-3-methyl-5-hydroxy-6-metoxy-1,4-benzoquinol methylase
MLAASYHDRLWEGVPEGSEPAGLQLRRSFLLESVERLGAGAPHGERPLRVLDFGCGEGRLTAELAHAGLDVLGVDVAEEPLRRARALHAGLHVQAMPLDGEWPLAHASFDVVWAGETIEHVADTAGWLSQVRRVLRSGGSLLLSTPAHGPLARLAIAISARRWEEHFDPRSDHLRFYTRRTLERLLADFGFERIEVRGAGGPPGARGVLLASAVRSRF